MAARTNTYVKGLSLADFGVDGNSAAVDVSNGKIIRIRPLHYDWKYAPSQFNPWKIEARGKVLEPYLKTLLPPFSLAYKKRVYSPNRVLYPLKRVDWDPSGERNTANRGRSGYVRISWTEAVDIIAAELTRIKQQYGMEAVLSQSDGHGEGKGLHAAHGSANRLLALLGGYTLQMRNPDSWEGWAWGAKHVWGMEPVGEMGPSTHTIPDISKNTEMLLFWGCDPETTPWGFNGQMASRLCYWFKDLGIKSVYICPDLNYGAAVHADKWIPIRPNTDAALQLAIAWVWISEDTYDRDYVATHTVGFDQFQEYVLGREDNTPKTPEWAEPITGIPAATIKALAREWATKRTSIAHGNGGAGMRSAYATEQARLEVILLAMQGLGKAGRHQVKMLEWGIAGVWDPSGSPMPMAKVFPQLISPAYMITRVGGKTSLDEAQMPPVRRELEALLTPVPVNPTQVIPKNLIHEAILNPPISWYGNTTFPGNVEDQFVKYTYPAPGCSAVHMVWTDSPCWITCWNDTNSFIKALRSPGIEFVLAQHPWLENDCQMADLILPVSTKFEEQDITSDMESGQYHTLLSGEKCIESVGESKSDYEIVCLIAEKMGLLEKYSGGKTPEEWDRLRFDHSGVQKMLSYQEFKEKGYFVIPTEEEEIRKERPIGLQKFCEEPEKYPLKTPSGKIEIYSQRLAQHFPEDTERPPLPHWIERGPNHDERISGDRAARYPLILISNHGRWRVHAQCDDITWTREIETCKITGPDGYKYEPLWINPQDAQARGIKNGDIIRVFNERGTVLGGAYVTERMMPGTVYMDHGARYDPIVPGEIDRGGAINTITPHNLTSRNATGMVVSSFLVEVAYTNIEELRQQYPEAFKRPYQSGAGLRMERVLDK